MFWTYCYTESSRHMLTVSKITKRKNSMSTLHFTVRPPYILLYVHPTFYCTSRGFLTLEYTLHWSSATLPPHRVRVYWAQLYTQKKDLYRRQGKGRCCMCLGGKFIQFLAALQLYFASVDLEKQDEFNLFFFISTEAKSNSAARN